LPKKKILFSLKSLKKHASFGRQGGAPSPSLPAAHDTFASFTKDKYKALTQIVFNFSSMFQIIWASEGEEPFHLHNLLEELQRRQVQI
jgi:hypothetical protein